MISPLRAAGVAALTAAMFLALAAGGSARPLQHPDGPDCDARTPNEFGLPVKTGLSFIVQHDLRFGFRCSGLIYKDGVEYEYSPKPPASPGPGEGGARAVAAIVDDPGVDPDTGYPINSKYTLKGEVTVPSATQHALGLSSKVVGSGRLSGPKPFVDTQDSEEYDSWTLELKPAFKAALKRKKVGSIALNYMLDVTLPPVTAYTTTPAGKVLTQKFGETVVHFSNGDADFKFSLSAADVCKKVSSDLAYACPAGLHR